MPRFFCKYICFQKAGYNLINRLLPLTAIKRDSSACVSCHRCDKVCPVHIKVSEKKAIYGSDCLGCYSCIDKGVCPEKTDAIHLSFLDKRVNPLVFSIAALACYYLFTWSIHTVTGPLG